MDTIIKITVSLILGGCVGGYLCYKWGVRQGTKSTLNILKESCNRVGVKEEVWEELNKIINDSKEVVKEG